MYLPANLVIRKHRVTNFVSLGYYEDALNEIDTLSAKDQDIGYTCHQKALVYMLMGDFDLSYSYADSLVQVKSGSSIAYDLKGLVTLKGGNHEDAILYFDHALNLNPDFAMAYYNRGLAKRASGDKQGALDDFNKAVDVNQGMKNVYFARALVKKEMGLTSSALEDCNKAIIEDEDFLDAMYNRAYTLKILGDDTAALNDAGKLVELDGNNPKNWNLKGNMHVLFGDYRQAIRSYTRAIDIDMDYAEAYYNRGIAHQMANHTIDGCADLHYSANLNFERARTAMTYFCGN